MPGAGAQTAPQVKTAPAAPVGSGDYIVSQTECVNSIARRAGFFWQTLWNHPHNAAIKTARKDHNILLPGDRLYVPEKTPGQKDCATDKVHTFKLKGTPSRLKIRLLDHDSPEPYAHQPYRVDVDGTIQEGEIDEEGNLEFSIDPGARQAILTVGEEVFDLAISGLDPIDSLRGALQRLHSLGFYLDTSFPDQWNDGAVEALKRFQSAHVLTSEDEAPSGEYDSRTRTKLGQVYGC